MPKKPVIPRETEPRGLDFATALDLMRNGESVSRLGWAEGGPETPMFLVLIPGRKIMASFEPMATHLGKDAEFLVHDHIDAILEGDDDHPHCVVGWNLSHDDMLADDWFLVP